MVFDLSSCIIFAIWLIVLTAAVSYYRNTFLRNDPSGKYFVNAFLLRAVGGLIFGLIHAFYYGYGDTFGFYNIGKILTQAIEDDPANLWPILTSFDIDFYSDLSTQYGYHGWYAMVPHTVAVAKASTFFGYLTGGSYPGTALFFGMFAFIGSWAMYRTFLKMFPALYREFAIAILFLPSVWFWGSGLAKDSLTFGGLGLLIFSTYNIFFARKKILINVVLAAFSAYLVFNVKPYIVVAFLPAALSWSIVSIRSRIKNPGIRRLFFPVAFIVIIVGFGLINQFLTSYLEEFSLENATGNVIAYKEALEKDGSAGSAYTLYSFGSGTTNFLSMTIPAVITCYFRPFPWEIHNVFAILSAAESGLMVLLFWRIQRRLGFKKMFSGLYTQPIVLFCAIFSIIFGIAVGVASQNFGTMVRYRIPALPIFMVGLFITYYSATGESLLFRRGGASRRPRVAPQGAFSHLAPTR